MFLCTKKLFQSGYISSDSKAKKKWSQRWEKFPPILNALLTNRNHDDDQKKLGEEDRKKQHFLFYLKSKFFDCFCDDWNIFVDQVCETCFPFMTFLFCVQILIWKQKKNNACKDLRTFKAIKKEINREICQKLSTKQLGSKQKRSSFTFLWLIATILCLINQSLRWIPSTNIT